MEGKEPKFTIGKRIYFVDHPNGKDVFSNFVEKQLKKKNITNIEVILAVMNEFNVSQLDAEDAIEIYKKYIATAKQVYSDGKKTK